MPRILITETPEHVGKKVELMGWISVRRDHGQLIFFELRDRSGSIQLVVPPEEGLLEKAKEIRSEFSVKVTGIVKERPVKAKETTEKTALVEIQVTDIEVLGKPSLELPIDISQKDLDLNLDTLLNNRTLALRHEKNRAIFLLFSEVLRAYDATMRADGFVEIKTPKILSSATEGGANFFKIKYFDRDAYLAQSPQFYKQAAMSAFERVFEVGTVFRAEPHFTSRHVNEYTGLDAEMGFIEGVEDVMTELEKTIHGIFSHVGKTLPHVFELYKTNVPQSIPIPRMRLSDATHILKKEYRKEMEDENIDSEGERMISEYVKKKFDSDLVFLTHYPISLRPFYSMPSPDNPKYTETFDLLFRGVEIASGGQRIHDYEILRANIEKRGLDPKDFSDYMDIFKYGTPPHGGWGLGSERIIQKLLGLGSIKEAVLYPRDVKRLTP